MNCLPSEAENGRARDDVQMVSVYFGEGESFILSNLATGNGEREDSPTLHGSGPSIFFNST